MYPCGKRGRLKRFLTFDLYFVSHFRTHKPKDSVYVFLFYLKLGEVDKIKTRERFQPNKMLEADSVHPPTLLYKLKSFLFYKTKLADTHPPKTICFSFSYITKGRMQRAKMFTPHPGKVTDPRYRVAREGRVPAYRQTNTRKDQQQDFKKTLNRKRFYAKKGVQKRPF